MAKERDHRTISRDLYGLINDLLGLDYTLRKESGQLSSGGIGVRWSERNKQLANLDFDALATVLDGLKGDDYPASWPLGSNRHPPGSAVCRLS